MAPGALIAPARGPSVRRLGLPLPAPGASPAGRRPPGLGLVRRGRPLKRWRYIGVYGPELMLCGAEVFIGPVPQRFWAVALPDGTLHERTTFGAAGVRLDGTRLTVESRDIRIEVTVEHDGGVESVAPSGASWAWTRKAAGLPARGTVTIAGRRYEVDAEAVIDDSAGYHAREVSWRWSAGVGRTVDDRRVAWNLVEGINDPPTDSERTLWVDGEPNELPPAHFETDLSSVALADGSSLSFTPWASRENNTNVGVFRSDYAQPFGTFGGTLGGVELRDGYGVMERHHVRW